MSTRTTTQWSFGLLLLTTTPACTAGTPAETDSADEGSAEGDDESGDEGNAEAGEEESADADAGAEESDTQASEDTTSDPPLFTFVADEASNYAFSSVLSLTVTSVAPGTELTFDWSAITTDLQGHAVDPVADVDMVSVIVWDLPYSELAARLNDNSLGQRNFATMVNFLPEDTGVTQADLFDFKAFGGVEVDPDTLLSYLDPVAFPPETTSFTVMAATGERPGRGTRMLTVFAPDATSDNTTVALTDDSTTLSYEVDLTSLTPTAVPPGTANIEVDFGALETTSMGTPFMFPSEGSVMLAHYALTPAELEERFLDIELIADAQWRANILAGTSLELTELMDESGAPFPGIDDAGTWVLALLCGNCSNPAPPYLTILQPSAGD